MADPESSYSAEEKQPGELCPRCGSVRVEEEFNRAAILGFLTVWPLLPVRRRYACRECGFVWKRFRW